MRFWTKKRKREEIKEENMTKSGKNKMTGARKREPERSHVTKGSHVEWSASSSNSKQKILIILLIFHLMYSNKNMVQTSIFEHF
jgi:hypothetical protein